MRYTKKGRMISAINTFKEKKWMDVEFNIFQRLKRSILNYMDMPICHKHKVKVNKCDCYKAF